MDIQEIFPAVLILLPGFPGQVVRLTWPVTRNDSQTASMACTTPVPIGVYGGGTPVFQKFGVFLQRNLGSTFVLRTFHDMLGTLLRDLET
jgi:hypothetical protein